MIWPKKVSVGAQNVLEQAKRYSQGVDKGVGNWWAIGSLTRRHYGMSFR